MWSESISKSYAFLGRNAYEWLDSRLKPYHLVGVTGFDGVTAMLNAGGSAALPAAALKSKKVP